MKKAVIFILCFLIAAACLLYLIGIYAVKTIEKTIISDLERSSGKKIEIGRIHYIPIKGISISKVRVYNESSSDRSEDIKLEKIDANINIADLITENKALIRLSYDSLSYKNVTSSGKASLFSGKCEKGKNILKDFRLCGIDIEDIDISSPQFDLTDIKGSIAFAQDSISSDSVNFRIAGIPYRLQAVLSGLPAEPKIVATITGDTVKCGLNAEKVNDVLKINSVDVSVFSSRFAGNGEITGISTDPIAALSGVSDINPDEISAIPGIGPEILKRVKLNGRVKSIYSVKGLIRDIKGIKASIENECRQLKAGDYNIQSVKFNILMKDGEITIPDFTAELYDGKITGAAYLNLTQQHLPILVEGKASGLNINLIVADSKMKTKEIYGTLNATITVQGLAKYRNTFTGSGSINISDGDLGPMPVLSPLVGNIYGVLRKMIPSFQNVNIKGGDATFVIKDEKIATEDLVLYGDMLSIYAKGYMDFDRNLNFAVTNEFKETSGQEKQDDLQSSIVGFMAAFGKMISKAYLTGTLDKPKWKFEYAFDPNKVLGAKITSALKNIFQ